MQQQAGGEGALQASGASEGLIRAGRDGDAWRFLAGVLEVAPEDRTGGVWALIALNCVKLGLTEPAAHALGEAEAGLGDGDSETGVTRDDLDVIRDALGVMGPARIDAGTLAKTLDANLALRPELRDQVAGERAAWAARIERERWYRATDGNVARLGPCAVEDPDAWAGEPVAVFDAVGASSALVPAPAPEAEQGAPPVCYVEGVSPPWLVRELVERRYAETALGASSRVFVVQRSAQAFLDGLAHDDLAGVLTQERVECFVDEGATRALCERLGELAAIGLMGVGLVSPGTGARCEPGVEHVIAEALAGQRARQDRAEGAVAAQQAGRTPAWWADRYARALGGGEQLRVLVMSCRFSTYIGAAGRDLADAFEDAGHEAMLFIEPDAHSNVTSLGLNETIASFDPDLIVTFNYPRGSLAMRIPETVPVVCWIQDPLPHLFDAAHYTGPGTELDFYVGHSYPELRELGLEKERLLSCPVLASERVFSGGRRERELECDIAIVTNHGEPPHEFFDRLCVSSGVPHLARDAIVRALGELEPIVEDPMSGCLRPKLERVAGEIAREIGATDAGAPALVLRHFLSPILDRVIRHTTARWALELAERESLSLHVYGRGWEKARGFEACARGPVEHGGALRDVYASAGVTVHASLAWCMHQRVLETALSGGVPAVLLKADDLSTLQGIMSRIVSRECDPSFTMMGPRVSYTWGIDHPAAAMGVSMFQRLSERLTRPRPIDGMNGTGFTGVFQWEQPREEARPSLASALDTARVLGDLNDIGFSSREQLAEVARRARDLPAWRSSISGGIATRTRAAFTYEAAAKRIPWFVGESIARLAKTTLGGVVPEESAA